MRDRFPELQKNLTVKYTKATEELEIEILSDGKLDEVLSEITKIRSWISEICEKTSNMKNIYSDPLYNVSQTMQSEMDDNMTMCSALGLKACGALKEFESRLVSTDDSAISRITRIQYYTTKQLCADALNNYETFLNKYKNSKLSLLRQQIKLTNQTIAEEECLRLLDTNSTSLFVENYQIETREALLQLQDIESRHKELIKIENSLKDLKEMFIQLAFLVSTQQEQINSVEYFATQATDYVDVGNDKLQKGDILRKKAQKKKRIATCIAIGLFIFFFLLIFLYV